MTEQVTLCYSARRPCEKAEKWKLTLTKFDENSRFRPIRKILNITKVLFLQNGVGSSRGYRVKNRECVADNTVKRQW